MTPEQTANLQGRLANIGRTQQKFIADVLTDRPTQIYKLSDYGTIRKSLFNNVREALLERMPLYNDRNVLTLENVEYDDPEDLDIDVQKKAILEGKSCTRRLRGEWVLRDAVTDKELSRTRRMTIMRVPYMTDRGTFIRNGREYAFTNIMRLEPGVYTKYKQGDISAQFNIKKGTGPGFSMFLDPSTGIFHMRRGTTNVPAYTVFRDFGISDDEMTAIWGRELFDKNKEAGTSEKARQAAVKLYNM